MKPQKSFQLQNPIKVCPHFEILSRLMQLFKEVSSDQPATSSPTDQVLQRLLTIVESQSQTIDAQAERILWLEEQHKQSVIIFESLEKKLESLSTASTAKSQKEFEDDEGAFIEI
jgi:hypothetical protein